MRIAVLMDRMTKSINIYRKLSESLCYIYVAYQEKVVDTRPSKNVLQD